MMFNYNKLRGKIKEVFGTQEAFAMHVTLSNTSVSAKLNNKVEFSQKEIIRSARALNIAAADIPEYFFTPMVQEIEQTG